MSTELWFIGDSDIDRWPKKLLPKWSHGEIIVKGYSGATLQEVVDEIPTGAVGNAMLIVCAGENDLSEEDWTVDRTLAAMDEMLLLSNSCRHLLFLGPKLEPWLDEDFKARKQYSRLSKALTRRCDSHMNVTYIDCMTMFCCSTGDDKGAVLGGKAHPNRSLFDSDQLHLSESGYIVWKNVLMRHLSKIMMGDNASLSK